MLIVVSLFSGDWRFIHVGIHWVGEKILERVSQSRIWDRGDSEQMKHVWLQSVYWTNMFWLHHWLDSIPPLVVLTNACISYHRARAFIVDLCFVVSSIASCPHCDPLGPVSYVVSTKPITYSEHCHNTNVLCMDDTFQVLVDTIRYLLSEAYFEHHHNFVFTSKNRPVLPLG